LFTILTHF